VFVAGWSLTKACNLKCVHCYNASGTREISELNIEECKKVVDKLKSSKVVAINFGGGECALRPDFIELCKYIHSKQIEISYTTNGTVFDRIKENLELFHDIGVSIDFADAKKHDWFRGKKGTFKKATETLKELVKRKINNEMVTCLTRLNCSKKELRKLYNLAKELGVGSWRLNRFRANGRGIDNKKDLALTKKQLKDAYTFLKQFVDEDVFVPEPIFRAAFGGNYYSNGDPSGFTAFRIQPNGEVSPSVFLKTSGGNIKEESLEKIMSSEIFRKIRERRPQGKCKTCKAYFHCKGGDAGASYLENGHFDGPDPLCWLENKDKKPIPKQKQKEDWNVHELYLCTLYVPITENGKPTKA